MSTGNGSDGSRSRGEAQVAKSGARSKVTAASAGDETRARIVDAALETLKEHGIVGTSARAIARTGDFNQALIFYHFGTVNDVLLAALDKLTARRLAQYEARLGEVSTLPELVSIARELHGEDVREGHLTVLSQLLAGSFGSPELGAQVWKRFEPWNGVIERAVTRVVAGTPFDGLVPLGDLAYAISSAFLGIELLTHLEQNEQREESLFATLELIAGLVNAILSVTPNPSA